MCRATARKPAPAAAWRLPRGSNRAASSNRNIASRCREDFRFEQLSVNGILPLQRGRKTGQSKQIKLTSESPPHSESCPMRLHQLAASTVLVLLQLSAAAAQEWPTRHITEIVPFGPGNSVDIVG